MAMSSWAAPEIEAFLRSQFSLQAAHYRRHYPDAAYLVILLHGKPIGRIYVHRSAESIHILDISLIAERRNQGIGAMLLKELVVEADETGKKVVLYVETYNPARHLYERLGFRAEGEEGVYQLMEYRPVSGG
jgi:ribosomal protein S18 acetylase RimI-like enzyme